MKTFKLTFLDPTDNSKVIITTADGTDLLNALQLMKEAGWQVEQVTKAVEVK